MIVLLHGFCGGPSSWDAVVAALGTTPLRLTIAGHLGAPAAAPPPDGFAAEVARLIALLPDEPAHLAGYSLGGRLALAIAVAAPEHVTRLSLIGVHRGLGSDEERQARRAADEHWLALLRAGDIDAFAAAWEAQPLFAGPPCPSANGRRDAAAALRRRQDPLRLAGALDAFGLGRMPELRATCPTRALASSRDSHLIADRRIAGSHNLLADAPSTVAEFLEEP